MTKKIYLVGSTVGFLLAFFMIHGISGEGQASVEEGNLTSSQATSAGPFKGDSIQIFAVTQFYSEEQWAPIEQAVSEGSDIVGIIPHNDRIFVILQAG